MGPYGTCAVLTGQYLGRPWLRGDCTSVRNVVEQITDNKEATRQQGTVEEGMLLSTIDLAMAHLTLLGCFWTSERNKESCQVIANCSSIHAPPTVATFGVASGHVSRLIVLAVRRIQI